MFRKEIIPLRTINYKVEHQLLETNDDLTNIYAGSEKYLELAFSFDENWHGCTKAICFVVDNGEWPMLLKDDKVLVPNNVSQNRFIRFYLVGKRPDGYRIQTQQKRIGVKLNG